MTKKIIPSQFWQSDNEIKNISRADFFIQLKRFGETHNIPNVSWVGVNVLRFFLALTKPQKVLEMGCANGFSSCVIADCIEKWNGKLCTGDVSEPSLKSAAINAKACRLSNIEFRFGNILETYGQADGLFDFIFIDAQKSWTHKFFLHAEQLLSENGIIIVDDTQKFPDKMKSFQNLITREKEKWKYFTVPEADDAIMVFTKAKK